MKYSLQEKLSNIDVSYETGAITNDDLISKSPDKMLHTIVVNSDAGVPHQILFTGERILDISKIREHLSDQKFSVDMRFYPVREFPSTRVGRIPPMLEEQGIVTLIDESVLLKERIHVASESEQPTKGFWMSPHDLFKAYPNISIINVSIDGSSKGQSLVATPVEDIERMKQVESIARIESVKPVLFKSSKDEISDLCKIYREDPDIIEEIKELLKVDCYVYGSVISMYFNNNGKDSLDAPKLDDIFENIGEENLVKFLSNLCSDERFHMPAEDADMGLAHSMFIARRQISFLMKNIIDKCSRKHPGHCPNVGDIMGQLVGSQSMIWSAAKGAENTKFFAEQMRLNPHRFISDIQTITSGFDQSEVSSLLISNYDFPEVYQVVIKNFNNPLYSGEHSFYANVLYVVMSMLIEKDILDFNQFTPLGTMHHFLMNRLGITDIVNDLMKQIERETSDAEKFLWRFKVGKDKPSESLQIQRLQTQYCSFRTNF